VRELALTSRLERAYRRLLKKDPSMQEPIERTLRSMAENVDDPRLRTHHLSGQLAGLYACSVAYDRRIVFSKQKGPNERSDILLLIDIGTHDEVY
jgi:mRNA interferase YafQ